MIYQSLLLFTSMDPFNKEVVYLQEMHSKLEQCSSFVSAAVVVVVVVACVLYCLVDRHITY